MVAVHGFLLCGERFGDLAGQRFQHAVHHHFTVMTGKILRPADRFHIIIKMHTSFFEIRQIAIRQIRNVGLHIFLRQRDKQVTDGVTDTTRPAVQHHPDEIRFIQTQFDKVVPGSQRTQMFIVVGITQFRVFITDTAELLIQLHPVVINDIRDIFPGSFIPSVAFGGASVRHGCLDGKADILQAVRQVGCGQ